MKTRKTELRIFTIADWEKEERYLQKRHREGWKFRRVNLLGIYHFERCTPEDVVYQLDYNEEGLKHKDEYVQMFQDCGWEYMQDFGGYSYFRKPVSEMQGEEKIFCDDESRLDMMRRVFAGRYLPILIILVLLILPNLFGQFRSQDADAPVLLVLFLILLAVYAWAAVSFGYRYWKLKDRLKNDARADLRRKYRQGLPDGSRACCRFSFGLPGSGSQLKKRNENWPSKEAALHPWKANSCA